MKVELFKALWGLEGSYSELFERIAEAGYAGVEAPMPPKEREDEFKKLLEEHSLRFIIQVFSVPEDHYATFEEQVLRAQSFNPVHIVSHSSRDKFSEAEQDSFFERALELERKTGVTIAHETHRHRAMYAPWATARILRKFPELKITADFSHWTSVCESLLEDMDEYVEVAIRHVHHVHARIGHSQGPQVSHPGGPEWKTELACFEGWWSRILAHRNSLGLERTTFTPEFGPIPYMPRQPYTGLPIADIWEVNEWMANRIRNMFSQ